MIYFIILYIFFFVKSRHPFFYKKSTILKQITANSDRKKLTKKNDDGIIKNSKLL